MKEGNFFKKILKVATIVGLSALPNKLDAQAPKAIEPKPIHTSNKSRADAYKDSLDNYNYGLAQTALFNSKVDEIKKLHGVKVTNKDPFDPDWTGAQGVEQNGKLIGRIHTHVADDETKTRDIFTEKNRLGQTPIAYHHIENQSQGDEPLPGAGEYPIFKKPEQPVYYVENSHRSPEINDYNDMMLIYDYNEARNEASKNFKTDDDNYSWEQNYSVKHDDYIAAKKRLRANGVEYYPISEKRIDYPNRNNLQDFSTFYKYGKPKEPIDTKGYNSSNIKSVDHFQNTSTLPKSIPFLNGIPESKWNTKYHAVTFSDGKKYILTDEEFQALNNKIN